MRCACIVVWALLLLLIAIPALRHASAPEFAVSSEISFKPAPRTAPSIARIAAVLAAVGVDVPTLIPTAVTLLPAPPKAPVRLTVAPLVPLRL